MLGSTRDQPLASLGDILPLLREGAGMSGRPVAGVQVPISVPVGPPLLVDGVTYKQAAWISPVDGAYILQAKLSAAVAIAGGTNTFALDNYDASANAARNVLSTATIDPTGVTAKEGLALTLSPTEGNRIMDEGDVLNFTLVCGTMTTDGEGYVLSVVVILPEIVD